MSQPLSTSDAPDAPDARDAAPSLPRERALLDRIIAHAPVAIAVLEGPDLVHTMVNPAYQAILGPEVELIGRTFRGAFPEVAAQGIADKLAEIIRTGEPRHVEDVEAEIPVRGGKTFWEGECVPLPNERGEVDSVLLLARDITERKREAAAALWATTSLREREERDSLVAAGAAAAIWDWDVLNHRVDFSPRWCELRGRSRHDVTDSELEWSDGIHPDDAPRVMAAVQAHFEGRTSIFSEEYRVRHADGRWIWILDRGVALRDEGGAVTRMAGSEIDITERRQAEATLRESEERYRSLFNTADVAIFDEDFSVVKNAIDELGTQGAEDLRQYIEVHPEFVDQAIQMVRITDVNPAAVRMLGASEAGELTRSLEQIFTDETRDVFVEELVAIAEGRTQFRADAILRTLQGRRLDVVVSIAFPPAAGDFSRVPVILHDITERKQAESATRESEARKSAVLEAALDGVISTDSEGRILEFNPAAERTFGHPREEVLGRVFTDLLVPERYRERLRGELGRYLGTGKESVVGRRFEMTGVRADGTPFPVEISVVRIPVDGPPLFTAYVRDITERKRAEAAVREADRRRHEFLATLSHELRNPLAPLRSSLHLLRHAGLTDSAAASLYPVMERQVDHLVRLVDDLMEMSRITRGSFELRREPVALQDAIRSAVETSQPLIDAAEHSLTLTLPPDPVYMEADPVRLAQVFSNLLNNAAKYTPRAGQIVVEACSEKGEAVVHVSDNGQGIDPLDFPRLFEMFSRGSRTSRRPQEGLGIGLALARRLVEMHGGTIEARSAGPGSGSRFTVRLPVRERTPEPVRRPEPEPHRAPHRVLVVDDNEDAASSLGILLNLLGADVRVEHDGVSALEAFDAYQPAMVVLDIGMPGMSGYEVARAIRAREHGANASLIALTGWGQEEDRKRAYESGFDHHLVKPARTEALQALLASLSASAPA